MVFSLVFYKTEENRLLLVFLINTPKHYIWSVGEHVESSEMGSSTLIFGKHYYLWVSLNWMKYFSGWEGAEQPSLMVFYISRQEKAPQSGKSKPQPTFSSSDWCNISFILEEDSPQLHIPSGSYMIWPQKLVVVYFLSKNVKGLGLLTMLCLSLYPAAYLTKAHILIGIVTTDV